MAVIVVFQRVTRTILLRILTGTGRSAVHSRSCLRSKFYN
nr:MAG TPA: hypothetical protein [Bacteriophage sp.]DAH62981.1 MAG TPA: hypothetical protein [Bacteriophage sp.]